MSPYLEARAVYDREPCARTFDEDLAAHLLNGVVHSTPEYFLMARKVDSKASHANIVNPWITFDGTDCWHVYLYAGDITKFFSFADVQLPLVSFERKNKIRFYASERIFQKVCKKG